MKTHLSLDDLRKTDASEELAALRERVAELQAETGYTDAIRAVARDENRRLREALMRYEDDFCEGWCKENGGTFSDCSGCIARAALAAEPASGEKETEMASILQGHQLMVEAAPPPPPTQGAEETAWRENFLQDDSKMPTRWPEHQGVSESAGTYADGWNACHDAMSAAIRARKDKP